MFNINAPEFLVILVIALVVIGPQRLPGYAETLGRWARQLRDMASNARDTVRGELGPDFDDVDWAKFDPRQYDPRRIVREALLEPSPPKSDPKQPTIDPPELESETAVANSAAAEGLVCKDDSARSQGADDVEQPGPVEPVNLIKPEPYRVPYDIEAT